MILLGLLVRNLQCQHSGFFLLGWSNFPEKQTSLLISFLEDESWTIRQLEAEERVSSILLSSFWHADTLSTMSGVPGSKDPLCYPLQKINCKSFPEWGAVTSNTELRRRAKDFLKYIFNQSSDISVPSPPFPEVPVVFHSWALCGLCSKTLVESWLFPLLA